jgi:Tat (twin-arginine translocation) pathway signal sequence
LPSRLLFFASAGLLIPRNRTEAAAIASTTFLKLLGILAVALGFFPLQVAFFGHAGLPDRLSGIK